MEFTYVDGRDGTSVLLMLMPLLVSVVSMLVLLTVEGKGRLWLMLMLLIQSYC